MSKSYRIKSTWVNCINFHYNELSSILVAETTFSSPDNLIILTPCVFLPATLISLTAHLITLPLLVDITISSPSLTGNDEDKNSFVTLIGLDKSMIEANTLADELENELNNFDEKLKANLSPLLTKYINRHRN